MLSDEQKDVQLETTHDVVDVLAQIEDDVSAQTNSASPVAPPSKRTLGPHGGRRETARNWTADEDHLLRSMVQTEGPNWGLITDTLNTNFVYEHKRTIASTRNRHLRLMSGEKELATGQFKNRRGRPNRCLKCGLFKKGHVCIPNQEPKPQMPQMDLNCRESMNTGWPNSTTIIAPSTMPVIQVHATAIHESTPRSRQDDVQHALDSLCDTMLKLSEQETSECEHLYHLTVHIIQLLKEGPLWRKAKAMAIITNLCSIQKGRAVLVENGVIDPLVDLITLEEYKNANGAAATTVKMAKNALSLLRQHSEPCRVKIDEAITWSNPNEAAAIVALTHL